MAGPYTFTIIILVRSKTCKNLPAFQIDVLTVFAFVWFSFSENDTERWEPGTRAGNEVASFRLDDLFCCPTHLLEMHGKERIRKALVYSNSLSMHF